MRSERDEWLLKIRPYDKSPAKTGREIEVFEKNTLQPIVTFQNDLIIFGFRTFLRKSASNFESLSDAHQKTFINDRLRSDPALKNSFINYVVGLFTSGELLYYTKNRLEVRRRIVELCVQVLEKQIKKLM